MNIYQLYFPVTKQFESHMELAHKIRLCDLDSSPSAIAAERSKTTRVARLTNNYDVTIATQTVYCDVTWTHHN